MRQFTLILIALACFFTGLFVNREYITFKREKAKKEFINNFKKDLPFLTPTEVFKNYWLFASQNRLDEIRLFAREIPESYWKRCSNDKTVTNFHEDVEEIYKEFAGNLYSLRHDISMMRANRPRLSDLALLNETVFEDEATVDFKYLDTEHRAFFKKEANVWKLFVISPMILDFMRVDEYAHPRPFCKQLENISENPQFELKEPRLEFNFEKWKP